MKKNICFYLLLAFVSVVAYAQQVRTPRGSIVPGVLHGITDMSASEKASLDADMSRRYPQAVRLEGATALYNCHGYAWHMSEGGNKVWINTTPAIYWSDGSYLEITEDDPNFEKIYYVSTNLAYYGDHSAIKASTENYFVSKWGSAGLYQHAPLYCPYESTTKKLRYFKLNEQYIEGPSHFCSSGTYYVSAVDNATNILWKVTTRDMQSGTSSTITYNDRTISISNSTPKCYEISATVSNNVTPNTYSMKATSGAPSPKVGTLYWNSRNLSGQVGLNGTSSTVEFINDGAQTVNLTSYLDWAGYEIKNPRVTAVFSLDHYVSYSGSTITLTTTDTPAEGRGELEVAIASECNSSAEINFYIPYINLDVNNFSLAVNAEQTEMTIASSQKTRSVTGIDCIEITTPDNVNVMSQAVNSTTSVTIDISSLSKGIYYVGIRKGNEIYYKKLTIN